MKILISFVLFFSTGLLAYAATDSITLQKMTTIERWEFKLQADGTATRTIFGSPRFGTVDEFFKERKVTSSFRRHFLGAKVAPAPIWNQTPRS